MNTQLQQLIEEMKGEFSMAMECAESWKGVDGRVYNDFYKEAKAIEKWIPKLEKILNEGSVAASNNVDNEFAKGWANRPC